MYLQVNKIYTSFLQFEAQVLTVVRCLSARLKLHRVDLYTDDEFFVWHSAADLVNDLEDDPATILQVATIFIGALVGRQ